MEHWKNAEQLLTNDIILQVRLENLAHFSLVESKIERITVEGLRELKEKLLHSPLFAIIALKYVNFENPEEFSSGFFNMHIPDSDDVMRIFHDSSKSFLEFKRIRRRDVPDDVIIES